MWKWVFLSVTCLSCYWTWANADCEARLSRSAFVLTKNARQEADVARLSADDIEQLVQNRFPRPVDQGEGRYWYLSHTDDGRWLNIYMSSREGRQNRIFELRSANNRDRVLYARDLTAQMKTETVVSPIPLEGFNEVELTPAGLVDAYIRHALPPDWIRQAVQRIQPTTLAVHDIRRGRPYLSFYSTTDHRFGIKLLLQRGEGKLILYTALPLGLEPEAPPLVPVQEN